MEARLTDNDYQIKADRTSLSKGDNCATGLFTLRQFSDRRCDEESTPKINTTSRRKLLLFAKTSHAALKMQIKCNQHFFVGLLGKVMRAHGRAIASAQGIVGMLVNHGSALAGVGREC